MTISYIYLLIAFAISFVFSILGTPLIIKLCDIHELYDQPNARKVHKQAIPRLGGTLFLPSMAVGVTTTLLIIYKDVHQGMEVYISSIMIAVGALLIYLIGILDDLKGMKAIIKFFIQSIAALLFPLCNLMISNLHGLFGIYEIPLWISYLLTVFIILLIVNAINLIDGIDGLASSLTFLILVAFTYLYYELKSTLFSLICISLAGALLAFFLFNFYGKAEKLKIFMGDSGSLFLGYVIAYLAIKYQMIHEQKLLPNQDESILFSFSLVFIPCIDVIRVAIQRILKKKPIFDADKTHIHHRIMDIGFGMHTTLAIILCLFSCLCLINWGLFTAGIPITYIFIADILIYSLFIGCIGWLRK